MLVLVLGFFKKLVVWVVLVIQIFEALFSKQVRSMLMLLAMILEVLQKVIVIFVVPQFLPYLLLHLLIIVHGRTLLPLFAPVLVILFVCKLRLISGVSENNSVILGPESLIAENSISLSDLLKQLFGSFKLLLCRGGRRSIRMMLFSQLVILRLYLRKVSLCRHIQELVVASLRLVRMSSSLT